LISEPFSPLKLLNLSEPEYWELKKPKPSDHIRVNRGLYNHHGIYVSDNEVIHFTGDGNDNLLGTDNEVISTNLSDFLKNGNCEIKIYTQDELRDLYSPETIIAYARACIGESGYNLALNNCEHFANRCTLGKHTSKQVENVLTGENNMGIFGTIFGKIGELFSGGSNKDRTTTNYNYSYTYEPDKVRVAEIENKTKLMLMDLQSKNITLTKEAQKEVIAFFTESQITLMKAKEEGFAFLTNEIAEFNEKIGAIYLERMAEISGGELGVEGIKKINDMLDELLNTDTEISKSFYIKNAKLNAEMNKCEINSDSYNIYRDLIENEKKLYFKILTGRVDSFEWQRKILTEQNQIARQLLQQHIAELNNKTLELCNSVQNLLQINETESKLITKGINNIAGNILESPVNNKRLSSEIDNQQEREIEDTPIKELNEES